MTLLQSNKEQAILSSTSLKNASNKLKQDINVTKDNQTTVAGNTNAHQSIEASKQTAEKTSMLIQTMSNNIQSVAEEFQAMDSALGAELSKINTIRGNAR